MVKLDIMAACCLIASTSTSSGDNIGSGTAIVVILYLNGWWRWIELSWPATFLGKMPWSPTIETGFPGFPSLGWSGCSICPNHLGPCQGYY